MNEAAHLGHDHGWFGELVEQLFSKTALPDQWQDFLSHLLIDAVNIFALLLLVMTVIYFLSSYINMDKLHHRLEHLKSIPGFLLAAVAGMISPFCSCSIMPVLMGLLSVGVPVSVCLCYLTASSLLNITAVLSLFAVAGPQFAIAYLIFSTVLLIASSIAFSLLKLDAGAHSLLDEHHHHHEQKICGHCFWHRLKCALLSTLTVFRKCWLYILLGVMLSSAIMAFFPMETLTRVVNENGFLSTSIVTIVGIPIHSDIFSIAPVLLLLLQISPAVAMAFALATMVLSIPSIVILTRALKAKTVAVYCGVLIALTFAINWIGLLVL